MIPRFLRMKNFRSFRDEQQFEFPEAPGLYLMHGENGEGKSTVWDALCWLLFERTPDGLAAGDVCNWDAGRGAEVELDFVTVQGEECTAVRTWKPNAWRLEWRDEGGGVIQSEDLTRSRENPVLGWLAMGLRPFLNCVLMAQDEGMFMDLKPGPQAELFSEVMGLDRWLDYSAAAGERAQDAESRARGLDRLLGAAEAKVGALARGDLKSAQEAWERDREERLGRMAREYEQAIEHDYTRDDLEAAERAEVALREDLRAATREQEAEGEGAAELGRRVAVLAQQAEDADDQLRRAERGEDCRECGQPLGPAVRREAKARYDLIAAELDRTTVRRDRALKAEAALRDIREALVTAERVTAGCRRSALQVLQELKAMEDEEEALRREPNPHSVLARRQRLDLAVAEDEALQLRRELNDTEHQASVARYWVRGFKEVRLALIAEALVELEVEANSAVEQLGLPGWELRFAVDRETKGGAVQRGFAARVAAPGSPQSVPWRAWSGGEAQRLRISGQEGLADLIRARTGATIPLEVWDEPTKGLNEAGVRALLEGLARRAQAEGRCIWIIDHRSHAFGGFAGTALVEKTARGSRIAQGGV